MSALRWADVELADGGDVVVTVRRSKTKPEIIPTSGAWSAAARPRSVACRQRPRRNPAIRSSVSVSTR